MKSTTIMTWLGSIVLVALSSLHAGVAAQAATVALPFNTTSPPLRQKQQQRPPQRAIQPPNVEQVGYGYNVLLGLTPVEQREALIGSELFYLTSGDDRDIRTVK
jgi:hypothetical protein